MTDSLQRVIVWRNLPAEGTDYCSLWRTAQGWLLNGTAIAAVSESGPVLAHYRVRCDSAWRTQSVGVELTQKDQIRLLQLLRNEAAEWKTAERVPPEITGCIDADLAITPATNILPIRPLNIPIGQSREVTAGWIKFPELSVAPLPQHYRRLSNEIYRYESGNNFCAEIAVDDMGFVVSYQNAGQRIVA